ncbi:MAG: phosphatidate cytidylyltransferase [Pseudomonadota bacterium]
MVAASAMTTPPHTETQPPRKTSDLLPRVLSGIVMIGAAVTALYIGGMLWAALITVLAALMCAEWQTITHSGDAPLLSRLILASAACGCLIVFWVFGPLYAGIASASLVFGAAICHWLQPSRHWLWSALGLVYVILPAAALMWLRVQDNPSGIILVSFLFMAVWATDIGGYFVGRNVGGPKIFPSISPKKTWSGSIGGALLAAICVVLLKPALGLQGSYAGLAMAAIVISIVSQLGDAFESALKRRFGVKDSGTIIPGHGGVLDRLDGLLFCAPILAVVIWVSRL